MQKRLVCRFLFLNQSDPVFINAVFGQQPSTDNADTKGKREQRKRTKEKGEGIPAPRDNDLTAKNLRAVPRKLPVGKFHAPVTGRQVHGNAGRDLNEVFRSKVDPEPPVVVVEVLLVKLRVRLAQVLEVLVDLLIEELVRLRKEILQRNMRSLTL